MSTTNQETVGDRTQYGTAGLPADLRHSDVFGYRDMGVVGDAYQIIFRNSWMPCDYDIPDRYRMHYARTEWHHSPDAGRLERLLTPKPARIVAVVRKVND